MKEKNPYHIIKSRYVTEKTTLLSKLQHLTSNRCLSKCDKPKYVFLVDRAANKAEIARAVEAIYSEKGVKVTGVNVINVKPKKRCVRRRKGFRSAFKKAMVTLESGDSIDESV